MWRYLIGNGIICSALVCIVFLNINAIAESKPNIIFVLADDLGWNGIGPNGNTDVDTPKLNRLAKEGI